MNKELEAHILRYEAFSEARDEEALQALANFEMGLEELATRHPEVPRDLIRKSIIKAHRLWALKQANKPPAIPLRT